MPNLADWTPGSKIQILVYGKSGTGKTYGAGTFPRPVFLDFDKGIATLRGPEFTKVYGVRDIVYEQFEERVFGKGGIVTQHVAFDDAYSFFEKMQRPDMYDTFDTWVVDSATMMSVFAANKAVILLGAQSLSQTFKNAQGTGLVAPRMQDYGAERSLVEQFIRAVKSSGKHVVLLCHEYEVSDKSGTPLGVVPLLTGKSREEVPLMFDEVYHLELERRGADFKRYLRTHSDGFTMAKTRYGVPDGTLWNYDAIQKALSTIYSKPEALNAASS